MTLAIDLNRRPSIERGQPKTDYRPPRGIEPPDEAEGFTQALQSLGTPFVNLRKLEAKLSRSLLDDIALLISALTYGEMMELGEALWKHKGEGEIDEATLPGILHRWATEQGTQ